jgi:general nucleoside transport system permease protein
VNRWRITLLRLLAPLAAVAFALLVSGLVLKVSGTDPFFAFSKMWEFGTTNASIASIIDRSVPLYFSGVAFAIAFKMGLFNIGVEGQYTIAAVTAAYVGAQLHLPAVLHVTAILLVAMAAGTLWAAIPGALKVTRGVHEVISTIMLNFIAVSLAGYLLANHWLDRNDETLNLQTVKIDPSGWFPALYHFPKDNPLGQPPAANAIVLIAVAVGVLYYVLIWRTRFGYDLRATGLNPLAAQASGVAPRAMVVKGMLLSGAIAGLVGMPSLLGFAHNYGLDFATGLGFTGITVALLGRNHPIGIAIGALLLAFLDRSSQVLDLEEIPKEIVVIMEGVIVLSVVVAYELVQRLIESQQRRMVGNVTPDIEPGPAPAGGPAGAPA